MTGTDALRRLWVPALIAAAVVFLALVLPADSPFSGDNGLRLWAAASGPGALDRAVPAGMAPRQFPPAMTLARSDGLRPDYGRLLPAAASLVGLVGSATAWRLLLALASLAAIPLIGRLADASPAAGALGFLAAGLMPYSLLFWEHGPAVTLLLLSALLLRRYLNGATAVPWWLVPAAAAFRLRPETLPALTALLVVMLLQHRRSPTARRTLRWAALAAAAGAAAATVFPEALAGRQVLGNMPRSLNALLGSRIAVLQTWTLPLQPLWALALAAWAAPSAALCLAPRGLHGGVRRSLLLAGLGGSAALLYPIARAGTGSMSLLALAPAAALLPAAAYAAGGPRRTLLQAGMLGGALVWLTAPTHGMFQFGPRFLMAPAALAAAGAAGTLLRLSRNSARRLLFALAACLALLGAVRGVLFCGYFRLRHNSLQSSVSSVSADAVCTDEEWLPLVCWPQARELPMLVLEPHEAESLAAGGLDLVWLSGRTVLDGPAGPPGYRGLRYSLPEAGSGSLPKPPPGEAEPSPQLVSI